MAIFSSTTSDQTGGRAPRTIGQDTSISILAPGIKVVGEVETSGVLKIDGTVEGTVRADGQVLIAKGGLVTGDIFTKEVVVGGEVRGNIHADQRVEVQPGSRIEGDVTTPSLVVQDGGELNGRLHMGTPAPKLSSKNGPTFRKTKVASSNARHASEELVAASA
ncbi:MAG: polymer-forming cytoskeletal protein [Gemmatimonadales bacterium]